MLLSLLLMSTSVSVCLATVVPLSNRAIVPTTDASAVIADLYSKYLSAAYSGSCLSTDCPGVKDNDQYCTSICSGIVSATTTIVNNLDGCINKSSCNIPTTAQLKPFNISINSGNCYLSAAEPKVQLVPSGHTLVYNGNKAYTISNKMNFVWSNLNVQCGNVPSSNVPSFTVTPWFQKINILFFPCLIKNFFLKFGFNFLNRLPCASNFTSNPTSSSVRNSFSGPLQFTQSVTVTQHYTFSSPIDNPLQVAITDAGVAPTMTYSFVFDAGVAAANQSTIQTAIENAFNNGDPSKNEVSIVKALYNNLIAAFLDAFCSAELMSDELCA